MGFFDSDSDDDYSGSSVSSTDQKPYVKAVEKVLRTDAVREFYYDVFEVKWGPAADGTFKNFVPKEIYDAGALLQGMICSYFNQRGCFAFSGGEAFSKIFPYGQGSGNGPVANKSMGFFDTFVLVSKTTMGAASEAYKRLERKFGPQRKTMRGNSVYVTVDAAPKVLQRIKKDEKGGEKRGKNHTFFEYTVSVCWMEASSYVKEQIETRKRRRLVDEKLETVIDKVTERQEKKASDL